MARAIVGVNKHNSRLARLTSVSARKKIGRVIYAATDKVRVEARRLIADGAIQGKGHVASEPGEAPNWEFGELANGIITRRISDFKSHTVSTAPHSDPLENGSSKMEARPFMSPATDAKREEIVDDVANAINNIIRRV